MTEEKTPHIPVLPEQVREFLMSPGREVHRIIDGTIGFGGHSSILLQEKADAHLLGLDRDEEALAYTRNRLAFAEDRVTLMHMNYSKMAEAAQTMGWDSVDTILLDIGVSSMQLDCPERGFSYRYPDAPLDMRMDQSKGRTAADLLNGCTIDELRKIFLEYGEIREAGYLAKRVAAEREKHPFETCKDFADLCDEVLGKHKYTSHRHGPPAPTLPFQALRIAVNGELEELQTGLEAAVNLLSPGGRLAVITFHSLEDRIVKNFIRDMAASCKCPPGLPVCICSWQAVLKPITGKPVTAEEKEIQTNPRAACAKLRVAEKLAKSPNKEQSTTPSPNKECRAATK